MAEGTHTISLRVCDDAGNIAEDEIQFVVAIAEQDDGTDPLALWQIAGIAAVAVALALAAIFVLRRRQPSPPGGGDAAPPEPPG